MDIKRKALIAKNKLDIKIQELLFPDFARIRRVQPGLDVISLGSRPGLFAFDFTDSGLRGFNLAVAPQTVEYDFRMLRNYHSFLSDKGSKTVLLPLCPFSLLKRRYMAEDGDLAKDLRYYLVLHHAMVNNYSEAVYRLLKYRPLMYAVSHPGQLKVGLSGVQTRALMSETAPDRQTLETSAAKYVEGWMREFKISSLNDSLSPELCGNISTNIDILKDMNSFCLERGITLVIVIPPLSQGLLSLIPEQFLQQALYEPLSSTGIRALDFARYHTLADDAMFYDALCLNKKGRRAFTKQVTSLLANQDK